MPAKAGIHFFWIPACARMTISKNFVNRVLNIHSSNYYLCLLNGSGLLIFWLKTGLIRARHRQIICCREPAKFEQAPPLIFWLRGQIVDFKMRTQFCIFHDNCIRTWGPMYSILEATSTRNYELLNTSRPLSASDVRCKSITPQD